MPEHHDLSGQTGLARFFIIIGFFAMENEIILYDTRKRIVIFFFYLICLIFYSCKPQNVPPGQIDLGYTYFPLDTGSYIIYDVQIINYKLNGTIDTQYFQLKEVVAELFIDNENDLAFRLERFKRCDSTDPWKNYPDSVWHAKITSNQAIKTENNTPFIKLIFPVENGIKWDGNSRNTIEKKEGDEYRIQDLGLPDTIGNKIFNNTLKVIQPVITSKIGQYEKSEVYANYLGLIYKESVLLDFCTDPTCIDQDSIIFGSKYFQLYNNSGKQ